MPDWHGTTGRDDLVGGGDATQFSSGRAAGVLPATERRPRGETMSGHEVCARCHLPIYGNELYVPVFRRNPAHDSSLFDDRAGWVHAHDCTPKSYRK